MREIPVAAEADNADYLAKQYAGTGALKTDFTRLVVRHSVTTNTRSSVLMIYYMVAATRLHPKFQKTRVSPPQKLGVATPKVLG